MRRIALLFPLTFAAACTAGLTESTFPTGSQTTISNADRTAVYVVDQDGGRVSRYDVGDDTTTSIEVGATPSRLARAGEKVFVTLRGERSLAVLHEEGGELVLDETVDVGAEPVGVVAREDGERLYVALSQEEAVVELDGRTLAEVRRFAVAGHPSFLALHPSGDALFVASAMGGTLSRVDLGSGSVEAVSLPALTGAGLSGEDHLSRRLTGDPWISADGRTLGVPGLFVDTLTPVDDPAGSGISSGGGYASSNSVVTSRVNPGVVVVTLDATGVVTDTPRTVFLAGISPLGEGAELVRSYPTSVTMPPSGDVMVVTMEASSTAIVVSTTTLLPGQDPLAADTGTPFTPTPADHGFATAATVFVSMDAGPRGVAFLDEETAYVDTFLDHGLRELDLAKGRKRAEGLLSGVSGELTDTMEGGASHGGITTELDAEREAGRKLFFNATDSRMAADGAGISCSTCHFEGRNDGLTWTFADSVRQTPTLAAAVAQTAPYTWTLGVDTIAAEATVTSQGRMGGQDITEADALAIQAFIQGVPEVDVLFKGLEDDAALRGKALFEREDVGCASCHPAPLYTDNERHDIYGLTAVNTPSLVGIASSAPYLHNGSAGDLRAVLDSALDGAMGTTGGLSAAEKDDLEAFLLTL